jgi:hypothetical protein
MPDHRGGSVRCRPAGCVGAAARNGMIARRSCSTRGMAMIRVSAAVPKTMVADSSTRLGCLVPVPGCSAFASDGQPAYGNCRGRRLVAGLHELEANTPRR